MSPGQSAPILPRPHRIHGNGSLRLRGDGEASLELDGSAHASVLLRGDTTFSFAGTSGAKRMPAPGELLWVAAVGTLTVRGRAIDVRVYGGRVLAWATGRLEADLCGQGEVEAPRGDVIGWGVRPRTLRLEHGAAVEVPPSAAGGAAA